MLFLQTAIFISALPFDLGLNLGSSLDSSFLRANNLQIVRQTKGDNFRNSTQGHVFDLTDIAKTIEINIIIKVSNQPYASKKLDIHPSQVRSTNFVKMFSGIPCGQDLNIVESRYSQIDLLGNQERIHVEIWPTRRIGSNGFVEMKNLDVTAYRDLLERLSRHVYSRTVGARTILSAQTMVGRNRVSTRTNAYGSNQFLKLRDWAMARSWTIESANNGKEIILSKGKSKMSLGIGSHLCIVEKKTFNLSDAVIEIDGSVYVPESLDILVIEGRA